MKISAASVAFLIVAGGSSTHHASAKTTVSDYTNSDNSNELGPKKMMRNGAISVLSDAESTGTAKLLQLVKDLTAQVEDLKTDLTAQVDNLKADSKAQTAHQAHQEAQIGGLKTELAAVTSHQDNGLETLVAGIAEQVYDSHHVNQTVVDIIQGMLASDAPPGGDGNVPPSPPNHLVSSGTGLNSGDWCQHSRIDIVPQRDDDDGDFISPGVMQRDTGLLSCEHCPLATANKANNPLNPAPYYYEYLYHTSVTYHDWGVQFWSTCK